ncbi:MAG: dihydrolipoyl dehydrogenase [Planctomycetes bacterium]|nr:dihydrolipoyl dehydrogenase [Planctomycetota bacterium]
MSEYDVAILGGGPGGYTAAFRAAQRGAKTCCIEAAQLGGTCLNVGCIATKAMLHAGKLAWEIGRCKGLGLSAGPVDVDGPAMMKHVSGTVSVLRKGVEGLLKARKVDVVTGRGCLVAPGRIQVTNGGEQTEISARSVIIATGSRPVRPAFVPWDSPRVMTTDQAIGAANLPNSVLIVGGGVIGCEFATIYAELGITTYLVEALDRLLSTVDPEASRIVARSLKRRKVQLLTSAEIVSMAGDETSVATELANGRAIHTDAALVAVGRQPNVQDIGLETLGIELDDGIIKVDERCRTNVDGVFAVGDVAERRQYAHLAARMGIVAAGNATGGLVVDDRSVVPECIFTHPEVSAVGLANVRATDSSEVRIAKFPLQANGLARIHGQTDGLVKLYARRDTGEVLGGLAIGPRAADLIGEIALAVRHQLKVEDIAETIHAHPTFAESVYEAAESWLGLPIHSLE